jgi:hypothetical protein
LLIPVVTAVANPPAAIVATPPVCEVQVTEPVKFCVELSEKVPVAVNCSVVPFAIEGFAGVTAIDTSVAEVTVKIVEPMTPPETALVAAALTTADPAIVASILLVPAAIALAIPPGVTVATFGF